MVLADKLRESIATRARALPLARHAWARFRRRRYERRIQRFLDEKSGRADRLPMGAVYEATMRCNLHCEFCYVGDLLNIEGEWRQELTLEALQQGIPGAQRLSDQPDRRRDLHAQGHHVRAGSLPARRAMPAVISRPTARSSTRSAPRRSPISAAAGFLKHISVSIDGPGELHDVARGLKARSSGRPRACGGCRRPRGASTRRCASASTRRSHTRRSKRSIRWSTSPRSSASTPSG